MKPTFLKYDKPPVLAMIGGATVDEFIERIEEAISGGADGFCVQLCQLRKEYRTKENLTKIFQTCKGKLIYITSYRSAESADLTDEQCAEYLLLGLDCGATLCDVMGDMFGRSPEYELTVDEEAVSKQKSLIEEIHRRGGEVLMSSHTYKSTSIEENLMIAKAQAERGADIVKIVNMADSEDEIPKYIEAIQKIKATVNKELLFLVSGKGKIIRYIGAEFGVCMYLSAITYDGYDKDNLPVQPLLKNIIAVRDNMVL